jgi:hypothetical protein
MDLERAKRELEWLQREHPLTQDHAIAAMKWLIAELNRVYDQTERTWQGNQDKEVKTLREMERTYTNRLGELARLAEPVCKWVISGYTGHCLPSGVLSDAEALMDYVETVRQGEIPVNKEWIDSVTRRAEPLQCLGVDFAVAGPKCFPDCPAIYPAECTADCGAFVPPAATFQTKEGDQAAQAHNGDWLQPTVNPFGHGCCDCGLMHSVFWRLVDNEGTPIDLDIMGEAAGYGEGWNLQLQFTRDEGETARLREHKRKTVDAAVGEPDFIKEVTRGK